jgi:cyanate permease
MSAIGPAFYGTLYDLTGGYAIPVGIAALLNLTAALCVLAGRKSAAAILSS